MTYTPPPTPTQAQAANAEVLAEMDVIWSKFPGLSQAACLDIACQTVAYRHTPIETKRAITRTYGYEREEVKAEGRHPLWR